MESAYEIVDEPVRQCAKCLSERLHPSKCQTSLESLMAALGGDVLRCRVCFRRQIFFGMTRIALARTKHVERGRVRVRLLAAGPNAGAIAVQETVPEVAANKTYPDAAEAPPGLRMLDRLFERDLVNQQPETVRVPSNSPAKYAHRLADPEIEAYRNRIALELGLTKRQTRTTLAASPSTTTIARPLTRNMMVRVELKTPPVQQAATAETKATVTSRKPRTPSQITPAKEVPTSRAPRTERRKIGFRIGEQPRWELVSA